MSDLEKLRAKVKERIERDGIEYNQLDFDCGLVDGTIHKWVLDKKELPEVIIENILRHLGFQTEPVKLESKLKCDGLVIGRKLDDYTKQEIDELYVAKMNARNRSDLIGRL